MFHVVLNFKDIACEGFYLLPLFVSQLPSEVANLNMVGLFEIVGWPASCYTEVQVF